VSRLGTRKREKKNRRSQKDGHALRGEGGDLGKRNRAGREDRKWSKIEMSCAAGVGNGTGGTGKHRLNRRRVLRRPNGLKENDQKRIRASKPPSAADGTLKATGQLYRELEFYGSYALLTGSMGSHVKRREARSGPTPAGPDTRNLSEKIAHLLHFAFPRSKGEELVSENGSERTRERDGPAELGLN